MKYYQVIVAAPFSDELTEAQCLNQMHNWLRAEDGTMVAIKPIAERDIDQLL